MRRIYRFSTFEFEPGEARLIVGGQPVAVQPKVLDLLAVFVESPGQLLAKERLVERLWPGVHVGEESLTQLVRKLRQALDDDHEHPRCIATVPRKGYRFVAEVEVVDAPRVPANGTAATPTAPTRAPGAATRAPAPIPARFASWRRAALLGLLAFGLLAASIVGRCRQPRPDLFATGQDPRRLTATPAREEMPALSADGALVVYSANTGSGGNLDLWLLSLERGEPVVLAASPLDEWNARLSPSGQQILFARGRPTDLEPELRTLGVVGGEDRLVVPRASSADWSPDGQEVVLGRAVGPGFEIVRRALASGRERRVVALEQAPRAVGWSADGRWVSYLTGREAWVVGADGGEPRRLAEGIANGRSLVWEGGARSLLADASWSAGSSRLLRLALDGRPPETLLVGAAGVHDLTVARDGKSAVFADEHKVRQVWRFAADGRPLEALALPTTIEGFDIDAGGLRLAFTDWDPAPGRGMLTEVELASGERRDLGDGLCPALSPDGSRVASLGVEAATMGLAEIELATGVRRLRAGDAREPGFSDGALFRCPAYAPDGATIAFPAVGDDGVGGLYLLAGESAARRALVGSFGPSAWSPSGRRLAACDFGPDEPFAVVLDVATGVETRTTIPCPFRAGPIWEGEESLWLLADQKVRPTLVRHALDGRELERRELGLARDPTFWGAFDVRRSADGRWWVLVERYESDLYLLTLAH